MKTTNELLKENLICRVKAGSHAYGTNIATSDVDVRGIFVADPINLLTPFFPIEMAKVTDEEDTELYELSNYMKLYTQGNPNILETLWVDQADVLVDSAAYQILRSVRQDLLSSKVAFTFTGYAAAQIKKVKSRDKWISNPKPTDPPKEIDYVSLVHNFTDDKIFSIDINNYRHNYRLIPYGDALFGLYKVEGYDTFDSRGSLNTTFDAETGFFTEADQRRLPMFIIKFAKQEYNRVHTDWKNYWEWKNNRNAIRSEMEEKFGYDCYSYDTEFLTDNGWKLYDLITSTDKLATFNIETHEVQYQNYIERFDNKYTGNLYHLTGQHNDALVTANHMMVIRPITSSNNLRFIRDEDDTLQFIRAGELPGLFQTLSVIYPKKNRMILPDGAPTQYDLNEMQMETLLHYLRVMGWFVSDGTCQFDIKGNIAAIIISQSKPQSRLTQTLTKLINYNKIYCTLTILIIEGNNYPERRWRFNKRVATQLYNDCGHGSHHKRIPEWVFKLTRREMTALLGAMIQGDGTKRDYQAHTYTYYTCNSGLADDVQRLALLCGYETSKWGPYLYEDSQTYGDGNTPMYQVQVNMRPQKYKNHANHSIDIIPVIDYRTVCFMVPNHTLITRRNGRTALHGNCKNAMHCVRLMRMGREILETGIVNVKRSDAAELLSIRDGAWSYVDILNYAEYMDNKIRNELYHTTSLPKVPNIKLAAKTILEVQESMWHK